MFVDKSQIAGFSIDKLKKPDMALSRGYSGHTSMILATEVSFLVVIFTRFSKTSTS